MERTKNTKPIKRTKYKHILLENNINLVKRLVWGFQKNHSSFEFEDLVCQAYEIYLDKMDRWDPKKGQFSTYIWTVIVNGLKNYCILHNKKANFVHDYTPEETLIEPNYFFEGLTELEYQIAKVIIKTPNKFIGKSLPEIYTRITHIFTKKGFEKKIIRKSLDNIKLQFNETN